MYKVDIPVDLKESAAIERRRNMEAARKARIFQAKHRQIGVDVAALDNQVKQSKERKADEQRSHAAYAAMMARNDTKAQLLDAQNQRRRDQMTIELNDYRALEQRKETSREWDLNDPNIIKNATPLGQNDHGVSSLQSFVGEDVHHNDRVKMQKEQIREWSVGLKAEREQADNDKQLQDKMYNLTRIQLDHKAMDLENQQSYMRKRQTNEIKEFNIALAEEQKLMTMDKKNEELSQNMTEIRNQVQGDMLTENPNVARSAFGLHRVIPDRWKGMSEQELGGIRQVQEEQRMENIAKAQADRELKQEWDRQKSAVSKAGILMSREQERRKTELRKQLDMENAELAKQQVETRQTLDQVVYRNVPTEDYYAQFNTTTR